MLFSQTNVITIFFHYQPQGYNKEKAYIAAQGTKYHTSLLG